MWQVSHPIPNTGRINSYKVEFISICQASLRLMTIIMESWIFYSQQLRPGRRIILSDSEMFWLKYICVSYTIWLIARCCLECNERIGSYNFLHRIIRLATTFVCFHRKCKIRNCKAVGAEIQHKFDIPLVREKWTLKHDVPNMIFYQCHKNKI